MHVQSFAPLGTGRATRLVLGTMPGRASLAQGQYYAHPRNAFWDIVASLFGIERGLAYPARVRALERAGVAVWDVLAACTRHSSLDSDILPGSIVPNDIAAFLGSHPHIGAIYFNGGPARQLFERHVLRDLPAPLQAIPRQQLPSTSPTHARLSFDDKLRAWSVLRAARR